MVNILIAGSGRSGTTWVGNVLSSCRQCYGVFEPLRAQTVPEVPTGGRAGQHPATYLRPEQNNAEWRAFFERLFEGAISNAWTRQDWRHDGSSRRLLPTALRNKVESVRYRLQQRAAKHCIIKEIRSNLMLAWLSRCFPVRIVYLTRHPCAVVGSRLRLQWADVLDEVVAQQALVEDYLVPYMPLIERAKTPLQRMTVHWCIENLVPLLQSQQHAQWITLSYETCLSQPGQTFGTLIERLALTPTPAVYQRMKELVSMPSAGAGRRHSHFHPLSEMEGMEVLEICGEFGIEIDAREAEIKMAVRCRDAAVPAGKTSVRRRPL